MFSKYSVLMSVYHKEKANNLSLAIQSMIDQNMPPDEFVLIKDGPLGKEKEYGVKYELYKMIKI